MARIVLSLRGNILINLCDAGAVLGEKEGAGRGQLGLDLTTGTCPAPRLPPGFLAQPPPTSPPLPPPPPPPPPCPGHSELSA